MSYRGLVNSTIDYQVQLRDREIALTGVRTQIRRPFRENAYDYYGDIESAYGAREPIQLIPKYDSYYQIVDLMGSDIDTGMPLECIIKVKDHIPNDALILLGVRNDEGNVVSTWWRVLSSRIRHLEGAYSRVATLTPVREVVDLFNRTAQTNALSRVTVNASVIRAQGGP